MQLLRELLEKIEAVNLSNGSPVPEAELEEGEKVVGVMPGDLRRFYAVYYNSYDELTKRCKQAHQRLKKIVEIGSIDPEDIVFSRQHVLEHKRQELVRALFWHSVEEAFPDLILNGESVGIRKDWQVVTFHDSPLPSLLVAALNKVF